MAIKREVYNRLKEARERDPEEAEKLFDHLETRSIRFRRIIFFLIILLLGLGVVFLSEIVWKDAQYKEILRDTFLALSAVGLVELLNLLLLSDETERIIDKSIRKNLPSSLNRVRLAGIVDFSSEFDVTEIKRKIRNCENCTIRILRMRFIEFESLKKELELAITENKCTVEIILLTPYATGVIKSRIKTFENNPPRQLQVETFQSQMRTVIRDIDMFRSQKLKGYQNKLLLNIHNSFVSTSLTGFDHEWKLGFFFLGEDVMNGSHLTVKGVDKIMQKTLFTHYAKQKQLSWSYPFDADEKKQDDFLREIAEK
ncbi:MAG: hypothetical protein PSV16_11030 [Flavobacterium sp.]|nr:hypothetical protein [Flavobacterium sp.]